MIRRILKFVNFETEQVNSQGFIKTNLFLVDAPIKVYIFQTFFRVFALVNVNSKSTSKIKLQLM